MSYIHLKSVECAALIRLEPPSYTINFSQEAHLGKY